MGCATCDLSANVVGRKEGSAERLIYIHHGASVYACVAVCVRVSISFGLSLSERVLYASLSCAFGLYILLTRSYYTKTEALCNGLGLRYA